MDRLDVVDFSQDLRLLEAILFASADPLSTDTLCKQLPQDCNVLEMLHQLKEVYASRGVNLVETDGFWSFRTAPDLSSQMKITRQPRRKLPRAASEVLAIIAYHQPVTRGEIESIRGVDTSKGTLDILLELGWVRPGKRREVPGRPLTWHTTQEFVSHFNLESLKDLPGYDELQAAGLLDARPVLSNLPRQGDGESALAAVEAVIEEDEEFASWVAPENQMAAAE